VSVSYPFNFLTIVVLISIAIGVAAWLFGRRLELSLQENAGPKLVWPAVVLMALSALFWQAVGHIAN
jgi:hypothetical protein